MTMTEEMLSSVAREAIGTENLTFGEHGDFTGPTVSPCVPAGGGAGRKRRSGSART